ncbi:hypothetical protein CI238_08254 [Colletotrichum incanum]|uniref:Uncharacterized protein n=1 Tax=Colletotrichum incanum TaxID=1573173 RepID=A0A161X3H8_COLIC|nr:hypothetical protein CI238_08254 [Colletotrichum incanum]
MSQYLWQARPTSHVPRPTIINLSSHPVPSPQFPFLLPDPRPPLFVHRPSFAGETGKNASAPIVNQSLSAQEQSVLRLQTDCIRLGRPPLPAASFPPPSPLAAFPFFLRPTQTRDERLHLDRRGTPSAADPSTPNSWIRRRTAAAAA